MTLWVLQIANVAGEEAHQVLNEVDFSPPNFFNLTVALSLLLLLKGIEDQYTTGWLEVTKLDKLQLLSQNVLKLVFDTLSNFVLNI